MAHKNVHTKLRVHRSEDGSLPENTENVQVVPHTPFVWLFYQYLCEDETPLGAVLLVGSLSVKSSRNRLASDVFNTFVAQTSLIYDVTDTGCSAQNGGNHGLIFGTLKRRILTDRVRTRYPPKQQQQSSAHNNNPPHETKATTKQTKQQTTGKQQHHQQQKKTRQIKTF